MSAETSTQETVSAPAGPETSRPAATTAPASVADRQVRRPVLLALIAGLLMFLSLGAWAIASPVGSSPDEDFHLASIWCGDGPRDGLCAPGSESDTRMVPDNIERAICYSHESELSAACQGHDFMDGRFGLVESDRVNGDGLYPSGYYFWTGLLAGDNMVISVLVMRLAHALLFSVLAVSLWLLLPNRNRFAYVGSMVATFVPFGMFLIPSINPSGWAIASAAMLLPALVGYFAADGWRKYALGGFAVLAALLGLAARGDSAAYTVIAALAAGVLAFELSARFWKRAILPIAFVVVAAWAFLSANQTGSALGGGMAIDGAAEIPKRALIFVDFIDLPELFYGVLGQNFDASPYTGLGWLDTPLPALVWVPTTFVFAAILFLGVGRFDLRKAIAIGGVGISTVAIPMYLLVQNGVTVGYQVQPRYIMPLLIMLVAVALMPSKRRGELVLPHFSRPQAVVVAVLLAVANSVALYTHMQRYITPGEYNLNDGEWWWRVGPQPFTVWALGSLAFALLVGLIAWRARTPQRAKLSQ